MPHTTKLIIFAAALLVAAPPLYAADTGSETTERQEDLLQEHSGTRGRTDEVRGGTARQHDHSDDQAQPGLQERLRSGEVGGSSLGDSSVRGALGDTGEGPSEAASEDIFGSGTQNLDSDSVIGEPVQQGPAHPGSQSGSPAQSTSTTGTSTQ